jgi:hypothetical protein
MAPLSLLGFWALWGADELALETDPVFMLDPMSLAPLQWGYAPLQTLRVSSYLLMCLFLEL